MGDHRIDLDLALHIPFDDLGHVGAPARAAERGAFPHSSRHQLKRPCRNLRARGRHADDDRLAPTAMAGFQRLPHHRDVAGAVERVIGAADLVGARFCHIDEMRDHVLAEFFWMTKWVIPKRSPHALRSLLISTPMIMSAPASRRPCSTLSPIPPSPKTIVLAPRSTWAVLMTAPMPVVTPQPM